MSFLSTTIGRIVALSWLAAAFVLCSDAAMADVKKWVEPNGRVNYGDHPPLGAVIVPFSIQPDGIEPERHGSRPVNYPDETAVLPRLDAKRPLPGWSLQQRGHIYFLDPNVVSNSK
jgi:hypothetical protein